MKYENVILDLDSTLIWSTRELIKNNANYLPLNIDGKKIYMYIRPYLKEFLEHCFNNHKTVSLWSLGTKQYVEPVLQILFKLFKITKKFHFVKTNEDSYIFNNIFDTTPSKSLNKIFEEYPSFNKTNTIFIDDNLDVHDDNYDNIYQIENYYGDSTDNTLKYLITYLTIV